MIQEEFNLDDPTPADLEAVAGLLVFLGTREGWTTAREIRAELGHDDRRLRHLAAISGGLVVSGPGCPGYRHVLNCTAEEVRATAARLEAQAEKMGRRARSIRAAAHRLIS